MKKPSIARSCLVLLALLLPVAPLTAQEPAQAAPPEPEPLMSEAAAAALDRALSGVEHEDFALTFRSYFFPSLQGGTLAMFGFEVGTGGLTFGVDAFAAPTADSPVEVAQLELFGALLQNGAEVARFGDAFAVGRQAGSDVSAVKSFGATLAAGSYELVWGVRDTVAEVTASRRDPIEVPDLLASGLGTSSVLVVLGQPAGAAGPFEHYTVYDGVRILTVAFQDDLDRVLPAGTQSVMLTYIVAGAQFDAATQAFNLELSYRILDAEEQSIWRAAPQALNRPTVGQQIPLGEIEALQPGGEYVFEILVKDLTAGTESTTRFPFAIAG